MSWIAAILLVLAGLFFSAFFSGSETGLYCVNRLRLQLGAERGDRNAIRLTRLLADEQQSLSVALIGTNLSNYITTAAVAFVFTHLLSMGEGDTELYTVLILTPIIFVFGEVTPKNLFQRNADFLMPRGSLLLFWTSSLLRLTGAVGALAWLARWLTRRLGAVDESLTQFGPKHKVAMLLREALVGDVAGDEQSELVDRVVQLGETPLHVVMVPRNQVVAMAAGTGRSQLEALARRTRFARVPVFDRSDRQIVGAVEVDALLGSRDWTTVGEKLLPVSQFGAHESVALAMVRMQRAGHHMGIVADRAGRMLGLVTLKDLVEEVVGELVD